MRRKRHVEHENHDRWLVSYADFITLLFAFFAVLYATSVSDVKKQEEFEQSIKQQFSTVMGFNNGSRFDELNDPRNNSPIKPILDTFPPPGSSAQEVEGYVQRKLEKEMSDSERAEAGIQVKHDAIGVRIEVAASKIFPSGSAELRVDSAKALEELGEILRESGRHIIIEGHSDDQPIKTERYPSNWELSASRATKIVRYLIAREHIPADRLTAVAYADQMPIVPNNSEENRAKNRRIEIMIVTGAAAL